MQYFFLKLIPPRPTFFQDITDEERAIMQEHGNYWKTLVDRGVVIVFGPVFEPTGVYGIGVIEANAEEEVRDLIANDPVRKADLGKHEYYPMRVGAVRK
jgi:uncharacterized protein YciI